MNVKERLKLKDQIDTANAQHIADWKERTHQITGVFVDVTTGDASVRTIDNTLDSYYELLNCDTIDVVYMLIDGKLFDIICDDDALLKNNPIVSAVSSMGDPMLCGNLFVVRFDGVDDVMSLTGDDAKFVLKHVVRFSRPNSGTPGVILSRCDYR